MDQANQQQQINAVKQEINELISSGQATPDLIVKVGNMAESTLMNKSLYPIFKEQIVKLGVLDEPDLSPTPDPSMLVIFVTLGKVAQQMIQSGELGV